MITIFRGSLFSLFFYCEKSVMGRLGRYSRNHHFIIVIERQDWLSPSPESYENWFPGENSRLISSIYTTGIIQIPIAFRHTEIPAYAPQFRPSGPVRRLPTEPRAILPVHCCVGRHLTALNNKRRLEFYRFRFANLIAYSRYRDVVARCDRCVSRSRCNSQEF
jgi:hypothetical protein